jgi:mRNA-degrading endonuclease HigB of HigAB toxin-antitoxin module
MILRHLCNGQVHFGQARFIGSSRKVAKAQSFEIFLSDFASLRELCLCNVSLTITDFETFAQLRQAFPHADRVGKLTVFNISSNKARLIAATHYNQHRVYIRHG